MPLRGNPKLSGFIAAEIVIIITSTEPGGKSVNEDFVIARPHPDSPHGYLCILADGQGGRSNGALAARTACETAWKLASQISLDRLLRGGAWDQILYQTDREVSCTGGFTTLVALAIDQDCVTGASSGDSKAFYLPGESAELVELTSAQRKNPPVGSSDADFVPFSCRIMKGGRLLMLSDGGWKYCGYDALRASFAITGQSLRGHFHTAILQRAGSSLPDDLSLIAVDCE